MKFYPTSDAEAFEVLAELGRRQEVERNLKDEDFQKQKDFIDEPARLAAALCTRRAGKSGGTGRLMLWEAIANPNSPVLYLLTTRDE